MATVAKRGSAWEVRWREPRVKIDEQGREIKTWASRRRKAPTKAAAEALARQIETEAALGRNWQEERLARKATLGQAAVAYVAAAVHDPSVPDATARFRSSMIGAFTAWAGEDMPLDRLSLALLDDYAASLPAETTAQRRTRHRKVLAVEQLWRWAWDRSDRYPGVPQPRRLTGRRGESDRIAPPPPAVAIAVPRWSDVDAMMGQIRTRWHRQAALVLRYTGIRASQVVGLRWDDVDLDAGILRIRAGRAGAKLSRGRAVPLHPHLQEAMPAWTRETDRSGLIWPARDGTVRRPETLRDGLARAWKLAKVPRERWTDPESGRAKPTHAIRRCVRAELIRAGVEEALALYLIGHSQGVTAAAYVPEADPESSPYWPRLVEAVDLMPRYAGRL